MHLYLLSIYTLLPQSRGEYEELTKLRSSYSLQFKEVPIHTSQGTITCDVSTGVARPYIPLEFRRIVFDALHSLSHPGIRATQHLLNKRFIWPGINKDVRNWAKSCLSCQRAKVHRHTKSQLGTFPAPDSRFSHVHIDIVGPLPS